LLAVQSGLDVHVLDVVSSDPKPDLVHGLGLTYHHDGTGTASAIFDAVAATAP
jgi:hypothetical protein